MSEKKRTFYDVLREELNLAPDDTPDVIAKNLKKSVDDELSALSAEKTIYDTKTKQSAKKIKSNVDNALDAIKKIATGLPAPEEAPIEEPVPEEPAPEEVPAEEPAPEEALPPADQLPMASKKVNGPTNKDKIKAYSMDDRAKKAKKDGEEVKLNEPVSKDKPENMKNKVAKLEPLQRHHQFQ